MDWKFWAILANFGQVVGANLAASLKFGRLDLTGGRYSRGQGASLIVT